MAKKQKQTATVKETLIMTGMLVFLTAFAWILDAILEKRNKAEK